MLMRFQGNIPDAGTSSKLGIFQLAFRLQDQNDLPEYVFLELERHMNWLKMHLKSPAILDCDEHFRAIAWFKPEAKESLQRIWQIKVLLESSSLKLASKINASQCSALLIVG